MNSPLRPIAVRFVLLSSLSLLAAAGCGRVPGQFEFVHNQAPDPGCLISGDENHVYQGEGLLDISLVRPTAAAAFWVFPVLKNNLSPSMDTGDPNQIFLESFAVDISVLNQPGFFSDLEANATTRALLHYKTPTSGSVRSGGSTVATSVPGVPTDLAAVLAANAAIAETPSIWLNLRLRAFGRTTTQSIESDPFNYPVQVCNGCLVANVQPCPFRASPANPGNECNVAQDAPVDCCLAGNDLICPPVVAQ